jgi:hypothetical protein
MRKGEYGVFKLAEIEARSRGRHWIPAFAGMTAVGGLKVRGGWRGDGGPCVFGTTPPTTYRVVPPPHQRVGIAP